MDLKKTPDMLRVELEDALERGGNRRDVRDILAERFLEEDCLSDIAGQFRLTPSAITRWLAGPLQGRIVGKGVRRRLVFAGFVTELEREERSDCEEPVPDLAAVC